MTASARNLTAAIGTSATTCCGARRLRTIPTLALRGKYRTTVDFNAGRQQLGEGTYGTVYEGTHRGHTIAIKVLKDMPRTGGLMEKFYVEMAIAFPLEHPNIVRTYGAVLRIGQQACMPHLIMELINGQSLEEALHGPNPEAMDEQRRWQIAADIAHGLTYLHWNGMEAIIHRDLKPANVMLARGGPAKLVDFGLACKKERGADCPPSIAGTLEYMAPEVVRVKPFNEASDIYSFGCVVLEMWTGRLPWDRLPRGFVADAVKEGGLPPALTSDMPDNVRDLVMRCLSSNPANRPTAAELVICCEDAAHACTDCAEELLAPGADHTTRDSEGKTALHHAARLGKVECMVRLLERGAEVSAADNGGDTPLHVAAWSNQVGCMRVLLDRGADVNAVNGIGNIPIHVSAWNGHEGCVRVLLERGAQVNALNKGRKTPLDLALKFNHGRCVLALRESGGQKGPWYHRLVRR